MSITFMRIEVFNMDKWAYKLSMELQHDDEVICDSKRPSDSYLVEWNAQHEGQEPPRLAKETAYNNLLPHKLRASETTGKSSLAIRINSYHHARPFLVVFYSLGLPGCVLILLCLHIPIYSLKASTVDKKSYILFPFTVAVYTTIYIMKQYIPS